MRESRESWFIPLRIAVGGQLLIGPFTVLTCPDPRERPFNEGLLTEEDRLLVAESVRRERSFDARVGSTGEGGVPGPQLTRVNRSLMISRSTRQVTSSLRSPPGRRTRCIGHGRRPPRSVHGRGGRSFGKQGRCWFHRAVGGRKDASGCRRTRPATLPVRRGAPDRQCLAVRAKPPPNRNGGRSPPAVGGDDLPMLDAGGDMEAQGVGRSCAGRLTVRHTVAHTNHEHVLRQASGSQNFGEPNCSTPGLSPAMSMGPH
jgi:hypothetical protein